jgi:hypothetical protein
MGTNRTKTPNLKKLSLPTTKNYLILKGKNLRNQNYPP